MEPSAKMKLQITRLGKAVLKGPSYTEVLNYIFSVVVKKIIESAMESARMANQL